MIVDAMMAMKVWVWKLETEADLARLQFLVNWVPKGKPN